MKRTKEACDEAKYKLKEAENERDVVRGIANSGATSGGGRGARNRRMNHRLVDQDQLDAANEKIFETKDKLREAKKLQQRQRRSLMIVRIYT